MTRSNTSTSTIQKIKNILKQSEKLVRLKRFIWRYLSGSRGSTNLDIVFSFPMYTPFSPGSYTDRAALTIQSINKIFPVLSSLCFSVHKRKTEITDIRNFPTSSADIEALNNLKELFDKYGSDKSNIHNYHNIYGPILKNTTDIKVVFEVGLGTNNTKIVSNMGSEGKPGASLRAFREFLPNAIIFGADIDKGVLFSEERIETFYVDQTDPSSFTKLDGLLPDDIDLIIDDGLHSPDANIQTLIFGLGKIKVGGWVVVEDINEDAMPIWDVVSAILPNQYESHVFSADGAIVFAVKRIN